MQNFDLVVAGAGIVGMSTALWCQKEGLRVLLCDGNPPGSGTTSGSACTIATYASVPINNPSIPASLPHLLMSSDSPLSFDWKYGFRNPRWMLSFLAHCRASKVRDISYQLGLLLAHANDSFEEVISECSADDLIVSNDCMYIWSTEAGFDAAQGNIATQRANGVALEILNADEARGLEPSLKEKIHKGLKFKGARHILSPRELVMRMHRRYLELGGKWMQNNVRTVVPDSVGVTVALENHDTVRGDYFALAAGAFSTRIRGTGAERLPLGVERGYSIVYPRHGAIISRPVGWAEAGLYATPMAEGLRFAGTVEIASIDAPSNSRNIDYLHRKSVEMFGPLGPPKKPWLGYRPTLPDSLPVIGPSPNSERVIFAFGHQHVGLTLGPVTGQIVSKLVQGKLPHLDISGLTPRRFWS